MNQDWFGKTFQEGEEVEECISIMRVGCVGRSECIMDN